MVEFLTWKHHAKHVNNIIFLSLFMIKLVKHVLLNHILPIGYIIEEMYVPLC